MKTLNTNSIISRQAFLRKAMMIFFTLMISIGSIWAQTYNPKNGFTHYPNGTVYVCNCVGGFGPEPVVVGPDGETVGCETEGERCREILEEADDDASEGGEGGTESEGGGGSEGTEEGEATTQSYSPEVNASIKEYRKQLKIKYGVWSKQNGKWIAAKNSSEWTKQIIGSWKKKK